MIVRIDQRQKNEDYTETNTKMIDNCNYLIIDNEKKEIIIDTKGGSRTIRIENTKKTTVRIWG